MLADGTNVTDDPANRPGFQALAELGVVSPLRRAGMTKDDVRAASRELGLFTADKPSFSCIAVHVGAGRPGHRPDACRDGRTPGRDGWEAPVSATRRLTIRRRLQPRWSSVLQ